MPTIYHIDDDEAIRDLMAQYLESTIPGSTIQSVASSSRLEELMKEKTPDAVIFDNSIKEAVTGIDLLRRMHVTHPQVGKFLFSGSVEDEVARYLKNNYGLVSFREKPEFKLLASDIATYLSR